MIAELLFFCFISDVYCCRFSFFIFLSWWSWAKVYQVYLFKEPANSFHSSFLLLLYSLYFIYFRSDSYDFFPSINFGFCSFSSCFRYKVRIFLYLRFFLFPEVGLGNKKINSLNFTLRTAFAVSHRFWIVFFFSFVSRYF